MLRDSEIVPVINYGRFHRVRKNEINILGKYLVFPFALAKLKVKFAV